MPIVRVGRDKIAGLIVGAETKSYNSTGAVMWVSSSTEGHAPATTWYGGAGVEVATTMESGYPIRAANVLQFRGLYSTAVANFEWNGWMIHSATQSDSGDVLLMSNQSCFIIKTSSQSVQFTTCVTVTT